MAVANKFMRSNYGEPLRKYLKSQTIHEIIDFGDLPVFESATTYPSILIASQTSKTKTFDLVNIKSLDFTSLQLSVDENKTTLDISSLDDSGWNLSNEVEQVLLKKLHSKGVELGNYVNKKIFYGLKTGLNEAFVIDKGLRNKLVAFDKRNIEIIKPFLVGKDIKKYQPLESETYLILFPKGFTNKKGNNPKDAWGWIKENYSAIATHLEPFKEKGEKRFDKGEYWWELRACEYYSEFEKDKIIYPNILKQPEFTFDTSSWFTNQKCFIIPSNDKYFLGLLNSGIMSYLFEKYLPKLRGGFYEPSSIFFKKFPIKKIDMENKLEKQKHDEIVKMVKQLLQLNIELKDASLETKKEQIQNRISYCEERINEIVYELYDLTEDEIKIIERK